MENNKIDEMIREYFNIFEEDLGFSSFYEEERKEDIDKRMEKNFKYFKAGFLFANINAEQVLNKQNALDFYFLLSGGD